MTDLVGVPLDCVHMVTREGGQIHVVSRSDRMRFDRFDLGVTVGSPRSAPSPGWSVGDPGKCTGDFVLSSGGLR